MRCSLGWADRSGPRPAETTNSARNAHINQKRAPQPQDRTANWSCFSLQDSTGPRACFLEISSLAYFYSATWPHLHLGLTTSYILPPSCFSVSVASRERFSPSYATHVTKHALTHETTTATQKIQQQCKVNWNFSEEELERGKKMIAKAASTYDKARLGADIDRIAQVRGGAVRTQSGGTEQKKHMFSLACGGMVSRDGRKREKKRA